MQYNNKVKENVGKTLVYVYEDSKYQPIMVYFDDEYPYGTYVGHFDTMEEAQKAISEKKDKSRGIPYCKALINFQRDHGAWSDEGLKLINSYEV